MVAAWAACKPPTKAGADLFDLAQQLVAAKAAAEQEAAVAVPPSVPGLGGSLGGQLAILGVAGGGAGQGLQVAVGKASSDGQGSDAGPWGTTAMSDFEVLMMLRTVVDLVMLLQY